MPTKPQLIKKISTKYSLEFTEDQLEKKSKPDLEHLLNSLELADLNPVLETLGYTEDEIDPNDVISEIGTEEKTEPSISPTSPEWTDYIMGKFAESEVYDKKPTCDGLRRVFELEMGTIISSQAMVNKCPTITDPDATVTWHIAYKDKRDGLDKTISDCFNVNPQNTTHPWCTASIATAATKAEARALRKGLRLSKVLSKEEVTQGFEQLDELDFTKNVGNMDTMIITDTQKNAIQQMCKNMNIDITHLLEELACEMSLKEMSQGQAKDTLRTLNNYQRGSANGGQDIPISIKENAESLGEI